MKIFISYATEDLIEFKIPQIAQFLEKKEEIEKIFYWERDNDSTQDVVEYMEQSIVNSDILIAVSSPHALNSGPVNKETNFAVYSEKRIIPIFKDFIHVREFVKINRGIYFQEANFQEFLEDLYSLIKGDGINFSDRRYNQDKVQGLFERFKRMTNKLFNAERDFAIKFTKILLNSEDMQDYFGIEIRDKEYLEDQFVGFMNGLYWIIPNSRTLKYKGKKGKTLLSFYSMKTEIKEKLDKFFFDLLKYVKTEFEIDLI